MQYELTLSETDAGTGYFACQPDAALDLEDALAYQRAHPFDEFMHRYLLKRLAALPEPAVRDRIRRTEDDPVTRALLLEACLLSESLRPLQSCFSSREAEALAAHSPSMYIRSALQPDQALHAEWARIFGGNLQRLTALPSPDAGCLPAALWPDRSAAGVGSTAVHIRSLIRSQAAETSSPDSNRRLWADTAREALERLTALDRLAGPEMRHQASLAPIGLLRKWRLDTRVVNNRHDYRLRGVQTAYGKGLSLERARVSCLMEIVERLSSFADIGPEGPIGHAHPYPLVHARLSELNDDRNAALDPNRLCLEAPYQDAPLYWMQGEILFSGALQPILVPAQAVYLFSNLDEISLFTSLGSTGLAAGTHPSQARRNALLEILERDAEATTLYDPQRCFRLATHDEGLSHLLTHYLAVGIDVFFQELTSPMGIPCYKCLVIAADGSVVKGTGAHLDAKRAVLSALTETPYPFPHGSPSRPGPEGLAHRWIEELPDYTTGSSETDLALLEALLTANGHTPVYVDLTRADVGLPVVRALVPGFEMAADLDRFSRISPRLWAAYRAAAGR